MAYFKYFPKTNFLNQEIVNLATGIKLDKLIIDDAFSYLSYTVEPGETPDHVAFNYYGSAKWAWLVLKANTITDPYWEWPLDTRNFEQFIKKKYGSIPAAQATTVHCEHKTKNITISADSLTVSNGALSNDYNEIDAYSYWDSINDNRRHIKLVNAVYIPEIDQQIRDLLQPTE